MILVFLGVVLGRAAWWNRRLVSLRSGDKLSLEADSPYNVLWLGIWLWTSSAAENSRAAVGAADRMTKGAIVCTLSLARARDPDPAQGALTALSAELRAACLATKAHRLKFRSHPWRSQSRLLPSLPFYPTPHTLFLPGRSHPANISQTHTIPVIDCSAP